MKKTIDVKKIKIVYDKETILSEIKGLEYDEQSYSGRGVNGVDVNYAVSEEEFNKDKETFFKKAEELLSDEVKLVSRLENSISRNKNGSMTKRRNNVALAFGAYRDYDDEYGSHSYTIDALMIERVSEFQGELVLSYYNEQSSF